MDPSHICLVNLTLRKHVSFHACTDGVPSLCFGELQSGVFLWMFTLTGACRCGKLGAHAGGAAPASEHWEHMQRFSQDTQQRVCTSPRGAGAAEVEGCFCALGLFIKGRQVASIFHGVQGAARAPLPSSLPAPASGGRGWKKGEQLLLGSVFLPGSWAPVLALKSCSLGDLR